MSKFIVLVLAAAAITVGIPVVASAAPSTPLLSAHVQQTESIQKADYYWNHRHWHHRRWDQRHRRWYYHD
jgi:hypothetical protein